MRFIFFTTHLTNFINSLRTALFPCAPPSPVGWVECSNTHHLHALATSLLLGIATLHPTHTSRFYFPLCRFLFHGQQAGELLIALEQKLHALRVVGEGGLAVAGIHSAVDGLVGFDQCGRHGERIVEVGERTLRELRAGIQHGLGGGFDLPLSLRCAPPSPAGGRGLGRGKFRPREVVVDDGDGILVVTL
jgi:hypothetical protein